MKNVWLKIAIVANIKKGLYKLEFLRQSEFFMNLSLITHWKYAVSCSPHPPPPPPTPPPPPPHTHTHALFHYFFSLLLSSLFLSLS